MKISVNNKLGALPARVNADKIKSLVRYALSTRGIRKNDIEINILLVDNKAIRDFNKQYLGRDRPTDVISFRMWEGPFYGFHPEILGDILVNVQMAKKSERGLEREIALYVVHGLLHLLGYEDDTAENAQVMQRQCDIILNGWFAKRSR